MYKLELSMKAASGAILLTSSEFGRNVPSSTICTFNDGSWLTGNY